MVVKATKFMPGDMAVVRGSVGASLWSLAGPAIDYLETLGRIDVDEAVLVIGVETFLWSDGESDVDYLIISPSLNKVGWVLEECLEKHD